MDWNPEHEFTYYVQKTTASTFGRASAVLAAVLPFALLDAFCFGNRWSESALVMGGALAAVPLTFFYGMIAVLRASGSPRYRWMPPAFFGGMLVHGFFVYLLLYHGLWSAVSLAEGFALRPLLRLVLFSALGYLGLRQLFRLTALWRQVEASCRKRTPQPGW
jgi:hypothetical protein